MASCPHLEQLSHHGCVDGIKHQHEPLQGSRLWHRAAVHVRVHADRSDIDQHITPHLARQQVLHVRHCRLAASRKGQALSPLPAPAISTGSPSEII